jgi:hypothetical protein
MFQASRDVMLKFQCYLKSRKCTYKKLPLKMRVKSQNAIHGRGITTL